MHRFSIYSLIFVCLFPLSGDAQDTLTNAFDDLRRVGIMQEEFSEMRQAARASDLERLLQERPASGFFCFTEDRQHDIRLSKTLPERWIRRDRSERNRFSGHACPGEFYTWQVGVFAPYRELKGLHVVCSDLKNEQGERIDAASVSCINTDGTDKTGKHFHKNLCVGQGTVQALWLGIDVPLSAHGCYQGKIRVVDDTGHSEQIEVVLNVEGAPLPDHGDSEGWRKSRLRWLNATVGHADQPTAPYTALIRNRDAIGWLGGSVALGESGLPVSITTCYDANNQLSAARNQILAGAMSFQIETEQGRQSFRQKKLRFIRESATDISWESCQTNRNFEVCYHGVMGFDGIARVSIQVKARRDISVEDMRLEVPYTAYASKYLMGLGHKGGLRPDTLISWVWDTDKHQDKIWMGQVNAGMNLHFYDRDYVRPLVNVYYGLGKLKLPHSWGNEGKGGIRIYPENEGSTRLVAYSGKRVMSKNETQYFNFTFQVTPVKPIDWGKQVRNRFYHSNSDLSTNYIAEARKHGANLINVHHKKDIYPFINYPYSDESWPDLEQFIQQAHRENIGVRLYYTTRELTVKIPELWAFRSLGDEVIHDGPGKDTRTLIHPNGPNEWLTKNLVDHFIPAWYNAFNEGKYAGEMDLSVITTPDSRWNNYYLAGLEWMVGRLGIDGIYIDDSALDRETLRRARRILDRDGKERLIDIHSWNHMNQWAGFANSIHLYTELLPYVDRTWIGEGFGADNTWDFWLVEMSGIPFGLFSETLDARNQFRGLVFGMTPRLPWSGNPVPLWRLWDDFSIQDARMIGFWDPDCPVRTGQEELPVTVYVGAGRALVVVANWTDTPRQATITVHDDLLGFHPNHISMPEIDGLQEGRTLSDLSNCTVAGKKGMIILLEK